MVTAATFFKMNGFAAHILACDTENSVKNINGSRLVAEALDIRHWHDVMSMLRQSGLRTTRQRLALGRILFGKSERHVTAEMLYNDARRSNVDVSLATIYNTLHQFAKAGLLQVITVDGVRTFFDTNTTAHHHFFIEDDSELVDIPSGNVVISTTPPPPQGYDISRLDVVVRLRKKELA